MNTTYSELGIRDTDNVIFYPAPNFMQPAAGHIKERVGEVLSPPISRTYRTEQRNLPETRFNNSKYSRQYQEQSSGGRSSYEPRITNENYVPSTEGTTPSRNYSFSNGTNELYTSSTRFNHVNQNCGYSIHPRRSIRETSLRVDSGQDGPREWSRREESIRETGESQISHTSDLQVVGQSAQSAPLNGFSPLPPFPAPNTPSTASSFRVTRKPTMVTRNGDSEIVTTEEMKKEDDTSETIIQRRTIRRRRVPSSHLNSRNGDMVEETQRSTSYNMKRRMENAARAPPRTLSQTNIHQYSNNIRNQWSSENNLRAGSYLKPSPIRGTYSAHQENLRRKNELNQHSEHHRTSRRVSETGYGEICQEVVSLLPIGRGIQDLESSSNAATLPRAGSQTAGRSYSAGVGNRGQYYSGTQSPVPLRQHAGRVVSEHRSRTIQNESHWSNYNGLGSSTGSLHGGSYAAGQGQTNHVPLDTIDSRHTLSNDLSFQWFRPSATRQEATQMLINKEPGRFIIRTSKSQPDCYALVVRVPITSDDSEPVRTFLLNRVKGGDAVHLRGFESEPIFPSLSAFVHDHTIHQGALPVLLKVPMRSALSSNYLAGGAASPSVGRYSTSETDFFIDVLYLGSVDVFPLQGESAVKRAVEQVLSQANNPLKGLKKKCEATVMCSVGKGITIADKNSTRFTKKSIPANKILYCSYDPDERVFNAIELKNRGVADSQIFAIVVKKTRFTMTEHAVYVMCQLEPHQPSSNLINFINQNLPVHYR